MVINTLNVSNDENIFKYDAILLNNNTYYQTSRTSQKRTKDSFIFDSESKQFANIESIFVINGRVYMLIKEKYETIFDGENTCKFNIALKELNGNRRKIIGSKFIGPKFALVEFDNTITCSKFPNVYEQN